MMTFDEFLTFTSIEECHYCAARIQWIPFGGYTEKYNLDRKDNALGYLASNCVVCCKRCNRLKRHDIPYEIFVKIERVLQEWERPAVFEAAA